jgi:hypothetical protein
MVDWQLLEIDGRRYYWRAEGHARPVRGGGNRTVWRVAWKQEGFAPRYLEDPDRGRPLEFDSDTLAGQAAPLGVRRLVQSLAPSA